MSSSVHASRAAFAAVMLPPCFAPARGSAQTPARSPERQRRALAVDVGAGWTLVGVNDVRRVLHPRAFSLRTGIDLPLAP